MTTVYLLTAGNIIDGYNEDVPNIQEVFTSLEAADKYGRIFDFHSVEEKTLDPTIEMPTLS